MKISYLFIIAAVVALVFGLALALLPEQLLSFYGASTNSVGLLTSRLFGAALLGYCVMYWLARNADESESRRGIVLGAFASALIGFVVVLLAQIAGVLNALGWINVAIYLLLVLGFGYFAVPGLASRTTRPNAP